MITSRGNREIGWVTLGSLVFALCIFHRLFGRFSRLIVWLGFGRMDWDLHYEHRWVVWYTITHFHQFPFWNPYKCGGMPLFAEPQSVILTPFLLLNLLFGPTVGLHVDAILHVAVAFGGAYFLARVLAISKLGSVACAGAFGCNGSLYLYYEWGDFIFLSLAYVPWAIALFFVGLERRRLSFAALGGLVMAMMVMEAVLYQLLFTASILSIMAIVIALQRRSWFPLLFLVAMGAFTAGFMAIKLLTGLDFSGIHATVRDPGEGYAWYDIVLALFWHVGEDHWTAYAGIVFGALGLIGTLQFRRALPWIVAGCVLLVVARGDFPGAYSPWVLLHKLPFFNSMRNPERWLIPFSLIVGVLAGFGIDIICKVPRPWGRIAAVMLIGLALIDSWYMADRQLKFLSDNYEPFKNLEHPEASAAWPDPSFHQFYNPNLFGMTGIQGYMPESRMTSAAQANRGLLVCYSGDGLGPKPHALGYNQSGYKGEQYLLGPGKLVLNRWTPNALSFDVDVPRPTTLVVNQNYDPSWRVTGPGQIFSQAGLLAVSVPAGKSQVDLRYRSREMFNGFIITLLTALAAILMFRIERPFGPVSKSLTE
jgi:hypothetical protein